ncbi:oligosaccharide flippase family protein [Enterococcus gilvus]|uniref:Polysaccharide biosynthesis family protein n=1 Tax=Enterococcus gilvus ATCC BAA-350 TaxID=1158614 RepID=R2VK16_9ENTE|nr:oligosaccharide flippase family protein [Enterococcus gilvus]EOI58230.1 polysaccharide biosynthesis family protein [Enterococcus gilvus ATCC BAA-350]EOW79008.1 polysaccharide biosynthesis family protein [Enterococcus gilvus ATCC BAA-350]OJG43934.1 polysaccharide biosynthesis family protein [Enterococcus gilvus]
MKKKLLAGTFWLSLFNMICKVLGFVYLIPWLKFMGTIQDQQTAQALYNVAYLPYALFLSLGTAGFPSGIAKKIAGLNRTGNRVQIKELFQSGLAVMEVIGIFSALLMFIFAPVLSKISPIVDHAAGTTAIRSLCFSLLLIPILSALRGYFQGLNLSFPFGISQLIEQLVRVIVILAGTYLIRVRFNGSILSAVVLSTFASCVGGLFAILYLLFVGRKRHMFRLKHFSFSPITSLKTTRHFAIDIIKESLPFVYVGSAISILQLIDQFSLKALYVLFFPQGSLGELQTLYTLASANPNKLAPILLAIIGSITISSLPLLSILRTKSELLTGISQILRLTFTFLVPSSIGMMLLSIPLNTLFFGYNLTGSMYLSATIISTSILGILTVLLSILQALSFHKKAMQFTSLTLLLKLLLQTPCIYLFKGFGLSIATILSSVVTTILAYHFIVRSLDIYPIAHNRNYYLKVVQSTAVMITLSVIVLKIIASLSEFNSFSQPIVVILLVGGLGGLAFVVVLFRQKLRSKLSTLF